MKLLEIYYKNCGAEKQSDPEPLMNKEGFLKATTEIKTEIQKALKHVREAQREAGLSGSSDIIFPLMDSIKILKSLVDE